MANKKIFLQIFTLSFNCTKLKTISKKFARLFVQVINVCPFSPFLVKNSNFNKIRKKIPWHGKPKKYIYTILLHPSII
jgi:hypothetical protein